VGFPENGHLWWNGRFIPWREATIQVAAHAIHYGSAVFEGVRCYDTPHGSICFRLDAHLRRLQASSRIYRMAYPLDVAGWSEAVLATIRVNRLRACYISIACGTGFRERGIRSGTGQPFSIVGVDSSAAMCAEARRAGLDAVESAWLDADLGDRQFDAAIFL
jgi:branched-chain amino acid aminotransferase